MQTLYPIQSLLHFHHQWVFVDFFYFMGFDFLFNFLTEFGCGYVLLGCFSTVLKCIGMFLMFLFCCKVLRSIWYFKSLFRFQNDFGGIPKICLCLRNAVWQVSTSKVETLENVGDADPLKLSSFTKNVSDASSSVAGEKGNVNSDEGSEGKDETNESEREVVNEDEVFDVMILRKMVKSERQKADAAFAELEKERTATASSAEEAMAMILRLQREKSSAEIQASQFQRMAEHKMGYDQDVIESLEWMITQHESQRSYLEEQIEIYRKELKQHMSDDELKKLEFDNYRDGSLVSSSEIESQAL
ncbi:putative GTD-binding domain-containing protein [Lupinus albus]|uniref:Putative GTD-binding domain-containing protein n=1 Tax=Lupinus albus TaxID=3870 RepID=A0A6A4PCS9_LUPAL|nr:putative GTD-binding domain-containing protein [Lupinus albus]